MSDQQQLEEKKRKIQEILKLKEENALLIHNVQQLQHLNHKMEHDLEYIQDYISKLIQQSSS